MVMPCPVQRLWTRTATHLTATDSSSATRLGLINREVLRQPWLGPSPIGQEEARAGEKGPSLGYQGMGLIDQE